METFSALLAICAENSPVPGEFPAQRPVTRSFDVFFDLHPNKRLRKQSWGWWSETPSSSLWRHRNGNTEVRLYMYYIRRERRMWDTHYHLLVIHHGISNHHTDLTVTSGNCSVTWIWRIIHLRSNHCTQYAIFEKCREVVFSQLQWPIWMHSLSDNKDKDCHFRAVISV